MATAITLSTVSRFVDGYVFGVQPRIGPPATLRMLLAELRVSFSAPDEQRAAVTRWLATNEPGPRLRAELMGQ